MGILLVGSRPSTLSYDGYLKDTLLAETLWFFLMEGEFLIVKLDNVKSCNEECHVVSRIYFVIIYYSPLKTNNSAIFFAM